MENRRERSFKRFVGYVFSDYLRVAGLRRSRKPPASRIVASDIGSGVGVMFARRTSVASPVLPTTQTESFADSTRSIAIEPRPFVEVVGYRSCTVPSFTSPRSFSIGSIGSTNPSGIDIGSKRVFDAMESYEVSTTLPARCAVRRDDKEMSLPNRPPVEEPNVIAPEVADANT